MERLNADVHSERAATDFRKEKTQAIAAARRQLMEQHEGDMAEVGWSLVECVVAL